MLISGTFDVRNFTLNSVMNGDVCFTVDYVEGHETPPLCFVMLTCTTTGSEQNKTIKGTKGCLSEVPPHGSYTIAATDADAVGEINSLVAVRPLTLSVENYTTSVIPSSTSTTPISIPTG